jgi:hypothetical protein
MQLMLPEACAVHAGCPAAWRAAAKEKALTLANQGFHIVVPER